MKLHAIFEVIKATPEYIYIKDVGHNTRPSVTNDVEWILQEIALDWGIDNKRIFYMDSLRETDEIIHQQGRFVCFKFGHEGVAL
jgi:hypothetical protein